MDLIHSPERDIIPISVNFLKNFMKGRIVSQTKLLDNMAARLEVYEHDLTEDFIFQIRCDCSMMDRDSIEKECC